MRSALAILGLAALCTSASAQPAASTAETLHNEGQAAYDRKDFATAVARWQASYKLSGESDLLFNLAQAYRQNGQCKEALFTYRRFVAVEPTADQRALADDFVRELAPLCGAPPPAAAPKANTITPTSSADEGHTKRVAGLTTVATGAALVTIGIVLGHHASTLGDEVTHACKPISGTQLGCNWADEQTLDVSGRHDATLGRVLDVVGLAVVVGGAALYYLGMHDAEVSVAPVAATSHEHGAVLSWRTSW